MLSPHRSSVWQQYWNIFDGTQVDEILLEAGLTDEEYIQFPRASQFTNPDHSHLDEDDDERRKFFLNLIIV